MTSWLSFLKSSKLKHCEILLSSFEWFQFLVTLLITHSSSAFQDCPQRTSLEVLMKLVVCTGSSCERQIFFCRHIWLPGPVLCPCFFVQGACIQLKVFSVFTVVRIYFLLVFKCLAIVPWSRTTLWQLVCISDYQKTISMTLRIIKAMTRLISLTPVYLYIISAMTVLSVWHCTSSELWEDLSMWHPYMYIPLMQWQCCQCDTYASSELW